MAKKITYADLTDEQKRARSKADMKWKAEHMTRLNLSFHNIHDADVIDKLESVESKCAYIRELIRADIALHNGMNSKSPKNAPDA